MKLKRLFITLAIACAPIMGSAQASLNPEWTAPLSPFRIADNLYYVGSRDLAAYLITTSAGNILINANLEQSPAQIRASVTQLGFKWRSIKIVLNSQAHFDHVGGLAQVLKETHAQNWVMNGDAAVIESGGRTDFSFGPEPQFPNAHVDKILHDGDKVQLGGITLVAHKTAGHTRGCTTFTLRTHMPGEPQGKLRNVVIAGGFMALSEYRLVAMNGQPASYPGITQDFQKMFRDMRQYPCDIFLGAHASYFNMLAKIDRMPKDGAAVWIDPKGYQAKINDAERAFNAQLAEQQEAAKK
jgi:metallo-beta-lactamase class B